MTKPAPKAGVVSVSTTANTPVGVTLSGTASGSGDTLTYSHGSPSHGTVSGSGAGLTYTPAKDYVGSDSFSFTVSETNSAGTGTATGVVSITVTAANQPVTAQSQSLSTTANTAVPITLSGTGAAGTTLTYTHTGASHGTVSGTGASLTYTPAKDYVGSDSFSFTVTDGKTSASGTVTVTTVQPAAPPVTKTVEAGGTASSEPTGGGTPSSPQTVVAKVTSPTAGDVTFTPITTGDTGSGSGSGSSSGSGSGSGGSGSGTGTTPGTGSQAGYTLLGQGFIISAPPATVDQPLQLSFSIDDSTVPLGTDPADLTVFRDGVAIAQCTDPTAKVAAPDPCVDAVASSSGNTSFTVLSSHASTWTFGTKAVTTPSKLKVAGIKGVSPGGTEKVAVRVWNSDGTFAANTPVAIVVSGANTANGLITTDVNGFGTFTYRPTKLGTDTVTATVGTVTGTATVHIVRPAQRPVLGTVSRHAGTVNVAVQTHPAITARKVKIYAVHKVRGHKATLIYVGYGMTNAKGRAYAVIKLPIGSSYVLKARMAGRDYVEHLSNRSTGTVK